MSLEKKNHTLLAVNDITENKTLEKHLEVARDEAKEADKTKSNLRMVQYSSRNLLKVFNNILDF